MKRLVVLALFMTGGCDDPPPRDVRLEFVPRPSCGLPPYKAWDADCIASLDVRVVDADGGNVLSQSCQPVLVGYATLNDLLFPSSETAALENAKASSGVRIELRAHNSWDNVPCVEFNDESLMVWGSSDVVDLKNAAEPVVNLYVECRPECDCHELRTGSGPCPPTMAELGVCGPISPLACLNRCDADNPCKRGDVGCNLATGFCEATAGTLCSECDTSADCAPNLVCIHRAEMDGHDNLIEESFCTEECPAADAATCANSMTCQRVDGTRYAVP